MLNKKTKHFSSLFVFALGLSLIPFNGFNELPKATQAVENDSLTLGDFDKLTSTFKDATGTELSTYQGITVSFASDLSGNEGIVLPEVDGYETVEDITTAYSKIIRATSPKTPKQIATDYISKIIFKNCTKQKLSIVLEKNVVTNKVGYFSSNDHYYMYVKYPEGIQDGDRELWWTTAYEKAKDMTYMGRQGYLATITSLEEDLFIYKITDGSIGWLGGTILNPTSEKQGQYYKYDDACLVKPEGNENSNIADSWYWACGPEIGNEFFDITHLVENKDTIETAYDRNLNTKNYYFNWNSNPFVNSSNRKLGEYEPNKNGTIIEDCLTTLSSGDGYVTYNKSYYPLTINSEDEFNKAYDKYGRLYLYNTEGYYKYKVKWNYEGPNTYYYNKPFSSSYSWNNIHYNNYGSGDYGTAGYVVEFGDQIIGDSNHDLSSEYFATTKSFHSHSENNYTEWTSTNSLPTTPGYYYLANDVALSETWTTPEGDIHICLNGNVISGDGTFNLINVSENSILDISDCDDITTHGGYVDANGLWHYDPTSSHVLIENEILEPIVGGIIVGGTTAIKIDGQLVIDSVVIAGNAGNNGGAIYISETGKALLENTDICYNLATNGAGIYDEGECTINGGSIQYNAASGNGSGVYHNGSTDIVLGEVVKIKNNTSSNVYIKEGKKLSIDEEYHKPVFKDSDYELIGITLEADYGQVVDCISDLSKYTGYFFVDDSTYSVTFEQKGTYGSIGLGLNHEITIVGEPLENGFVDIMVEIFPGLPYPLSTAAYGQVVYIGINADPGYMLSPGSLKVNDGEIEIGLYYVEELLSGSNYQYYFTMPNEDVEISLEFELDEGRIANSITNFDIEDAEYGQPLDIKIESIAGADSAIIIYSDSPYGPFTTETPTSLGTWYAYVLIEGTNEYTGTMTISDVSFKITKCTSNEISSLSIEDWLEGEDPNSPVGSAKVGTIEYFYSTEENGTYTSEVPTDAGTYYLKAVVNGTENYVGAEKIISFNIKHSDNEILTLSIEDWFEGETPSTPVATAKYGTPTFTYSTEENGTYTSEVPTEAGVYFVKASVAEGDTYNGTSKIASFVIKNSDNVISSLSIEDWIEGETPSTPVGTAKYGTVVFTYSTEENGTYTSEVPTEAGTYYLKASVEEGDTYNGTSKVISFVIKNSDNEILTLSIEDWIEGETPSIPVATAKYGTPIFTYSTEENGTYTSVVPTDAGTYYLKASVEEGDTYNGTSKVISFAIKNSDNVITSLSIDNWFEGETPSTPVATAKYGTPTFTYSTEENGTYTSEVPTEAGVYYVKATVVEGDTYNGTSKIVSFIIKNSDNVISSLSIEDWVEGETPSTPVATAKYGTIVFTYSTEENGVYTSEVPTEAGTYYLKASVVEGDTYNATTKVIQFKITEPEIEPTPVEPTNPDDGQVTTCFIHWLLIGFAVLAIACAVLYVLLKFKAIIAEIVIGALLLATIALGVVGVAVNECILCLVFTIVCSILIAGSFAFTFLLSRKRKENKADKKEAK